MRSASSSYSFEGARVLDVAEHPLVDAAEAGIAAMGEGAQEIERRGGMAVGLDLPARIGTAGLLGEGDAVDDVAAVARQLLVAALLGRRRARLGELAGDAADLHHRRGGGIGQDHRHLQEGAEEIADVVGVGADRLVLGEALGAIAALEQEGLAFGDAGERIFQVARLTCKNQRRELGEVLLDGGERGRIVIDRHLLDGLRAPALRCPALLHGNHSQFTPPPTPALVGAGYTRGPRAWPYDRRIGQAPPP